VSKRYNIKWRDIDEKEARRVVRNYNSKINRIKKNKVGIIDFLPKKAKMKDIRKIKTRQDFNRLMKSYKRFSKRGSEDLRTNKKGVIMTKYRFNEAIIKTQTINRYRTRKRKLLSVEKGTKNNAQYENLLKRGSPNFLKEKDFNFVMQTLERQIVSTYDREKAQQFVNNYKKSIDINLLSFGKELKELIDKIDIEDFTEEAISNPFLATEFIYGKEKAKMKAERMIEELIEFVEKGKSSESETIEKWKNYTNKKWDTRTDIL